MRSGRPRRRRRSDWRTPAGSTRARSSAKRSRSGYIDGEELGAQARVLGQVDAPAGVDDELVEAVEQLGRGPGTAAGMSSASVQPGSGNDSGPGLPGPKRLSTARNDAARASLSISSDAPHRRRARRRARRTGTAGTRGSRRGGSSRARRRAGGRTTRSSRAWPCSAGVMRNQNSLNARDAQPVEQAVRRPRRRREQRLAASKRERVARAASAAGRRARAWSPRDSTERPSDAPLREAVDPRDRVAVVGRRPRACAPSRCRGRGSARCRPDQRRLDRQQPQRRLGDDAGEAHAAGGAPEQLGVGVGRDRRPTPFGVCSTNDSTWLAKLPSTWWNLPWMSAAIAPPTVTWRVPGVTGTNQPSGTSERMSASRLTPASTRTTPRSRSMSRTPASAVRVEHGAAGVLRRVAVAAAEPAGDQPASAGVREHGRRRRPSSVQRRPASPRSARCGPSR